MTHPLDNPVLRSLTGPHLYLARTQGHATRYPADISPFCALPDEPDAADWADDKSVAEALAQSESLGWLVSFVLRPDPTRLAPSAPFDQEQEAWTRLVEAFEDRLDLRK